MSYILVFNRSKREKNSMNKDCCNMNMLNLILKLPTYEVHTEATFT